MGTLTVFFTVAFLGCSVALMFTDWQKQVLGIKFLFDIQIYNQDPAYDFSPELEAIQKETKINDSRTYRIWENHTDAVNTWLYTHLRYFENKYKKPDAWLFQGNSWRRRIYSSDLQIKQRIYNETGDFTDEIGIFDQGEKLTCKEIRTEPFSQDGHNGGDYVLVVPDERISKMNAYYAEMVVDINGKAPAGLQNKLDDLTDWEEDDDETSPFPVCTSDWCSCASP